MYQVCIDSNYNKSSFYSIFSYDQLDRRLGPDQLRRRQQASATTSDASTSFNNNNDDNGRDPFCLSSEDVKELSTRLHVTESVIKCNADRLRPLCHLLLAVYETFQRNVLEREDITVGKNSVLNSKQISLLLEFFLQIDGKYYYYLLILIIDFIFSFFFFVFF